MAYLLLLGNVQKEIFHIILYIYIYSTLEYVIILLFFFFVQHACFVILCVSLL